MKSKTTTVLFYFLATIAIFSLSIDRGYAQAPQGLTRFDSLLKVAEQTSYQNFEQSDSLYRQAEKLITTVGIDKYPLRWINLSNQRAAAAHYNGKVRESKKYLDQSFASIQKYNGQLTAKSDSLTNATKFLQGLYFRSIARYDEALQILGEVQRYIEAKPKEAANCMTLFRVTQYQASIYAYKGEHESSINQYMASIPHYNCYRDKNTRPNYVLIYRNIGAAYQEKGDMKKAHQYFLKARANLDSLDLKSEARIRTHALVLFETMAGYFIELNRPDSARYYFQQTLPLLSENPAFAYRIYNGQANIALTEKQFEKALTLYSKSLTIALKENGEKHRLTSRSYYFIGSVYEQKGDPEKALEFTQKSLNSLTGIEDLKVHNYNGNPTLQHVLSKKLMAETLHQKARLLNKLYLSRKWEQLLKKSQETSQLAIQLIDSTRNEFSLEKDKVVLGEEAFRVYETAIQTANLMYQHSRDPKYLWEAFELMDKSKSAVLLDHLKLVKNFSGVPPEMLEREQQLQAELVSAEGALFDAEVKKEETALPRQTLEELKKSYTALFADIKKTYPQYYRHRIENKTITLPEVQHQMLRPEQALVEYFVGEKELYMICATKVRSWMAVMPSDSLAQQVVDLRDRMINSAGNPKASDQALRTKESARLYKKLIAPWIGAIDTTITSLIIVPQGILTYLPFEMLAPGVNDGFLIDDFAISYAASASLLSEQKQMKVSGNSFAGFNADYSNRKDLPPLAGSMSEVSSINELFGGRSRIFTNATADDFRKEADHYMILHLALHSYVNDERPMFSRLVFTQKPENNGDITANELYGMHLNAELAVLSACETGIGQLHRGEGMMSLSRAFMYAGVPSTIISLWKVPDQATSLVMTKFYAYLRDGLSKDEALAKAKKDFIKDYPQMASPFFWAGFVVNGKADPVSVSGAWLTGWKLVVVVILVCSIIFFFLWARQKFPFRINRRWLR